MPEISVVIPTYNAEKTIVETIGSVQSQTFTDFEILVINDGSTDSTLEVLKTIDDDRLKVFTYENGGAPLARNRGISLASGEFIAFLDSDDLWLSDKLECQLAALKVSPETGLVYSWVNFIDTQGNFLYPQAPIYHEGDVYPQLLIKNFLACGSNPLIRKQAIDSIGGFDPSIQPTADWDYWLRLSQNWHFKVIKKFQVLYRLSSQAMSSNIEEMERSQLQTVEKAFKAAPNELQIYKNESLAYSYQYLASLYLDRDSNPQRFKKGGQKLLKAIRSDPKILSDKLTRRLLRKWLVMRFLPASVTQVFTKE